MSTIKPEPPMMECGHAANAVDDKGNPVCVICAGIHPGYRVIAPTPDLSGRTARCFYYGSTPSGRNHEGSCKRGEKCLCEQPSNTGLAFFARHPDKQYDEFYCGCWGWD